MTIDLSPAGSGFCRMNNNLTNYDAYMFVPQAQLPGKWRISAWTVILIALVLESK